MNKKLIIILLIIVSLFGVIGAYQWFQKYQHQKNIQRIADSLKGHDDRPQVERDFENYKLNGIVEFNNRQFANAVQQFMTALALKPEDIEARLFVISTYKRSGSFDLAEEFLTNSLKILPQNPELLTQLGYVYLDWGKLEKAKEVFQKLVDSNIDPLEGYDGLAEVEIKNKDYDKAVQYFRNAKPFRDELINQIREKEKVSRSFYRFASLLKETGHSELAGALLQRILKLDPFEIDAYVDLAQIYEYMKAKDKALKYYNEFIQIATPLHQDKIDFAKQRIEALQQNDFLPPPPVIPLK